MKKAIFIIFPICLLFSALSVNAAPSSSVYTFNNSGVSGVPLYTTAEDFMDNIESDKALSVVVESVSNDSYSDIGKNSFVTEDCLLKYGDDYYSIDTVNPIERQTLRSGESEAVSGAFNRFSPYIMLSFSMSEENGFSPCGITLRNGGKSIFSFVRGSDGFSAIVSGGKKERLLRYSSGESLFAEIFISTADEKIVIEKIYINGEECSKNLQFYKEGTTYSLSCESVEGTIDNLFVGNVGSITSLYKESYLIASGENVRIFENYGTDNTDSVFMEGGAFENADASFGTEIVLGNDSLTAEDLFSQNRSRRYKILSQMPTLGKVRLFKNGKEIYAVESGAVSVRRVVPEDCDSVTALYSGEGILKDVSFSGSPVFNCEDTDNIKVFLFSSDESIIPVTVAAYADNSGIYANDGYETRGAAADEAILTSDFYAIDTLAKNIYVYKSTPVDEFLGRLNAGELEKRVVDSYGSQVITGFVTDSMTLEAGSETYNIKYAVLFDMKERISDIADNTKIFSYSYQTDGGRFSDAVLGDEVMNKIFQTGLAATVTQADAVLDIWKRSDENGPYLEITTNSEKTLNFVTEAFSNYVNENSYGKYVVTELDIKSIDYQGTSGGSQTGYFTMGHYYKGDVNNETSCQVSNIDTFMDKTATTFVKDGKSASLSNTDFVSFSNNKFFTMGGIGYKAQVASSSDIVLVSNGYSAGTGYNVKQYIKIPRPEDRVINISALYLNDTLQSGYVKYNAYNGKTSFDIPLKDSVTNIKGIAKGTIGVGRPRASASELAGTTTVKIYDYSVYLADRLP